MLVCIYSCCAHSDSNRVQTSDSFIVFFGLVILKYCVIKYLAYYKLLFKLFPFIIIRILWVFKNYEAYVVIDGFSFRIKKVCYKILVTEREYWF